MAEEVSSTVKTSSDGSVKLSKEAYDILMAKAAEKPPVIHEEVIRNVQKVVKTPEVAASDNKMWGASLFGLGVALVVIGGARFYIGVRQAAALSNVHI